MAGYAALANYHCLAGRVLSRTPEELDRVSLEKLWHTGFNVDTLDEAHHRYKLSPIRSTSDIWTILGHKLAPKNATGGLRFTEAALTALAIQYPSLLDPGDVYPHGRIIRIRYPEPVYTIRGKGGKSGPGVEQRRYDQPLKQTEENVASEPYFLFGTEQHKRLYDTSLPLIITEGELKGAALGLAGFAAIAFGGVNMWVAPKKAGKHKLHHALDPNGPCKSWAIPILDRPIYLIPDTDYRTNQGVRRAFLGLGHALLNCGSQPPRIVNIPDPPRPDQWKGIDDYLTHHLGKRWSGDVNKIAQAVELVNDLTANYSCPVRQSGRYLATSVVRGAERLYDMLQEPEQFTGVLLGETFEGCARIGWLTYAADRYHLHHVAQSVGNTNGRVVVPSVELQILAEEAYEMGVDTAIAEGEITDRPDEMPTDYPNRVLAALNRRLPERKNNLLIEPFLGVQQGDFCIRIDRALINLTRYFDVEGSWERREQWLLPPNSRWWATGCINVYGLGNMEEKPTCPTFMDMIRHGFDNDPQSIDCLQLFMGKIIANPMFLGLQQFLALYGQAGSGKSTLYRIVTKLLGPANVAILRAQFAGRFDTANLPGKRLLVFQETPDGTTGDFTAYMAEVIKQITGQDTIVYERKGFDSKAIQVDAEVMTVGNDPPIIPMNEEAFRRRVVFLKMFHKIEKRDHRKEAYMLAHELPGIFVWALEGALKLFQGTEIKSPDRCLDDLEDVTTSIAPEERYVATQFKIIVGKDAEKHRITPTMLFEHYQDWVRKVGGKYNPVSNKKLGILLRQRYGITSKPARIDKKVERCFEGLAFVNPIY